MEKEIGKLPKNDTTDIVLRIDDFADKRGFTIREFVTSDRYTGFTKSGVRILAKDWQKFKEMINSVNDEDMKEDLPEDQKTLDEAAMADAQAEEQKAEKPSKEELPDY
jgi:hypothetical protein